MPDASRPDRSAPPERIELTAAGVVMRRHRGDDVDALHEAIEQSRDHLRLFMFWADQDRAASAEFVGRAVAEWDAGTAFGYLITPTDPTGAPAAGDVPGRGSVIGGCGVGRAPSGLWEIGYWLRSGATGRGVMTAVARALTDLAFSSSNTERVAIRCDVANTASAAVARRLGFTLTDTVDHPVQAPGHTGRIMVWTIGRGEWPVAPPPQSSSSEPSSFEPSS